MGHTEWWREEGPEAQADEFARALTSAVRTSNEREVWLALLKAQFHAPSHTTTAMELMAALRRAGLVTPGTTNHDYVIANGAYGRLARVVANELNFSPPRGSDGDPRWWTTLSYGREGAQGDRSPEHFQWVMRPAVADALARLRWMGKPN